MIQNDIYEKFRTARRERKHLVDVSGLGSWFCPQFPEIGTTKHISATEKTINEFQYCPFCGKEIENNREEPVYLKAMYRYY